MKYKIFSLLLALVMLIGLVPFTATEVHAVEVDATAEGTEPFTGDFTLELWNTEDTSKHETHQMTHNGTDWNVAKTDILPATAFAYTGNTVTVTSPDNYSVELTEDQSTEDAFNAADVMIATGTATKDAALDLNFEHYFAKVTFKATLATEFDETDEITDLYVMTKDSSTPEVTAYNPSLDVYHAYVTAGTYAQGDTFAKVDIGGDQLVVRMPGETTLTAGTHYTFDLKVGKDKVTIEQVSTENMGNPFGDGWNTEVNLGASAGTIGTADVGKTEWVSGDQVIATLTSQQYGEQTATLTYDGTSWTYPEDTAFKYLKNETPTLTAVYAPSSTLGKGEYISAVATINGDSIDISFEGATRNYSRLRIAVLPNQELTVETMGFTPAGATSEATEAYTLTTDENGNAYLYGTFAKDATVYVDSSFTAISWFTFSEAVVGPDGTESGTSYTFKQPTLPALPPV